MTYMLTVQVKFDSGFCLLFLIHYEIMYLYFDFGTNNYVHSSTHLLLYTPSLSIKMPSK